jgi:two-component system LytT family sensor kinase
MQQLLIILLVKVAGAASIASILSRSGRFLNLLLREERSLVENLQFSLSVSLLCAGGSLIRIYSHGYQAADICLEAGLVCGVVGGYLSGLVAGVVCSLPATLHGEYLAMPLYAVVGVLGGLLRDLAPETSDVWRFSPFLDLNIWRLLRSKDNRQRSAFHILMLTAMFGAELLRLLGMRVFHPRHIFTLYVDQPSVGVALVFITTVFTVSVPIKIWNSARNERLLEAKERMLAETRLAALSRQINPHFLFNTLTTVSSLIRTNPDKARQVVVRLSNILRRLLRKTDNFAPLRDELAFIDDYLSIEIARFGDKLTFVKEIDEAALDRSVPTMILQPLIENSIKHGLTPKLNGGSIRLTGRLLLVGAASRLVLAVEDDGVGLEEVRLATLLEQAGIGVSNVNERLQVLFGSAYRLEVSSRPGSGTRTEIEIPA